MSENLELHSSKIEEENEIEEYHEINHELMETSFTSEKSVKTISEYDFFTQTDVKLTSKNTGAKKKSKKRDKSSNLMDMITSELASMAAPIEENVISMVDYTTTQQYRYLETPLQIPFRRLKYRSGDVEYGWKHSPVNLNPVYPKMFENTTAEEQYNKISVEYIPPKNFVDLLSENDQSQSQTNQNTKFLDIEMKDLKFKHHHHFSLQRLLSVKLNDFYKDYLTSEQKLKELSREIKIIRQTKANLKEDFLKASPKKKEVLRFDNTLRKYTGQLLELKEKYFEEVQNQKELVHKIISIWFDMEIIREKTKFIETPHSLIITRHKLNKEEYNKERDEIFTTEFNDTLDKIEYDFVTKYFEYKKLKHTMKNEDDSAKIKFPKPKLEINEDLLKEEVEEIVNNLLAKEKIDISLVDNKEFHLHSGDGESITIYKYYFEINVDGVFVCESEHITSKSSFVADIEFHDSLTIEILPNNHTLSITLYENNSEISSININLEDFKTKTSKFESKCFVLNEIISPTLKHVGCGHSIKEIALENKIRLRSSNIFKGNLYTTVEVDIKIGWNATLGQTVSETIKSHMETGRLIARLLHGVETPNIESVMHVINNVYNIDINNDETIIKSLRNICKTTIKSEEMFSLDENSPEFVRFKLLHLRNIGGFANIENKLIPIHASQISTEQLNCLQKSKDDDLQGQYYSDKYSEMDPIELQRFIGSRYVQKLNKNVQMNLNEHLMRKTHKDVVRDIYFSFKSLFSKQQPLNTVSTNTKQQQLKEGIVKVQEIRVMVARAFNLPERRISLVEEGEDEMIAGYKVHPLRPFVKITYRGCSSQTGTGIGCHPTWNQTLELHTRLDPLSSVHISVFDEPRGEPSGSETGSHRRARWLGELSIPLCSILSLGSLRGTFKLATPPMSFGYETSTKENPHSLLPDIINLMKKESAFVSLYITTSLSSLGGLQEYNQPNSDDDYLIKYINNFVTSFVNDFPNRSISLTYIDSSGKNKCVTQFLQPIPLPNPECWPKNPKVRSESALSKSSGLSKGSNRRDEAEKASSHSGEERESLYSVGSFRSGESQVSKLMYASLRYVALIPTYEITETHTVTLMGLELLKVLHGSALDHALLLASYFLHLGVRCYVAVGLGLPRGYTAYVLTKYDHMLKRVMLIADREKTHRLTRGSHTWHVYDAVTGDRTELRDVGCPLKTVLYVFDTENIWVNSQNCQDVQNVSFDFNKSSDWHPVFDKSVFLMKQPTVSESGLYTNSGDVERLRNTIESKLKEKIQRWRPHHKTIWNRYCSSLLKEMLPLWEYWAFNSMEPKPAPSQRLKQLMLTYKMYGFPLNVPYVSLKSLLTTVKSTGVHVCDDPNAEFGLAVQVFAYPNNVISVWVFLASITRI